MALSLTRSIAISSDQCYSIGYGITACHFAAMLNIRALSSYL